ncbi:hypothetical protein F4678DRAFT_68762 [Xylaria arbuscula]|nr:hypothetical protein F4678DRAFT_68762 [Xylaria arbuscula]
MTLFDILMDPLIFENPKNLWLERRLTTSLNLEKLNYAFIPFSCGNWMCMGVNLAWAELYIALEIVALGIYKGGFSPLNIGGPGAN